MNGPEHYAEAEKLAGERGDWYFANQEDVPAILARAQVHATLALAAATALQDDPQLGCYAATREAWFNVAGVNAEAVSRRG